MKQYLIIASVAIALTSCTTTQAPQQGNPVPSYPQTQSGSPAVKFCSTHGGTVSYEKAASGAIDLVYCNTKDGQKIDAWKYMSDSTTVAITGATRTGVTNP